MSQTKAQLIDNLVQPITGALGSASAPTFSFTSDPNTGLYSPGADQLALTTGGTGRLFIDSNGNIGLGTSSLINSAGYTTLFLNGSTGGSIGFKTGDVIKQYIYSTGTTLNYYGGGADSHIFYCSTEKMRLTATGLGIGTSSPTEILTVSKAESANTFPFHIENTQNWGWGVGLKLRQKLVSGASVTDSAAIVSDWDGDNNSTLEFYTVTSGSLTEKVRITSVGRVGIGTSSPGRRLVIAGDTNTVCAVQGATNGTSSVFLGDTDDESIGAFTYNHVGNHLEVKVNGAERVRVDSLGRVGIGTTSPASPFQVRVGTNQNIAINSTGSNARLSCFDDAASASVPLVINGSDIRFTTEGTERVRIDSSGRLLVGTSSSLDNSSGIQNYVASGQAKILNRADSLVNGQVSSFQALGYANAGQPRYGELGLYKHSGITNACAFLSLNSEDAAFNYLWTDNSDVLRISTNADHIGTTSGTVVGTQTSDERLKNILGPVEYGLNTLKQIEPVRYSLKSQPETEQLGFIAQQVQPLVPQSVFDTKEHIEGEPEDAPTKLGMEYVALIPVLVNAIKELSAEVDVLKAQLQAQ